MGCMSAANEGKHWHPGLWEGLSFGSWVWNRGNERGCRLPSALACPLGSVNGERREEGEERHAHTLSHAHTYIFTHVSHRHMVHATRVLSQISELFDFGVQVSYPVGGFSQAGMSRSIPHPHCFFS